jgi:LAO/AO transport system kinase
MTPTPRDLAALAAGGKAALARALTALERAPGDPAVVALLDAAWGAPKGVAVGLTGPPGVGKSTLVNGLLGRLRASGATVGVIAVDPSSRLSGGSLLGDRSRIATDPEDAGAFVRSMAARSHLGGLAEITFPAIVLLRAVFDWVIVETVGVGQSETEIADCTDLVVACVQPGSGDSLQFMKAGVMEVPDLVLVTKGDLGAAATRAAAEVRGALSLAGAAPPEVAVVSAWTGEGLDVVAARIVALATAPSATAARPGLRNAQGRAWTEARLVESFGRVGHRLLAPHVPVNRSPFDAAARISDRASDLLHQSFKNL